LLRWKPPGNYQGKQEDDMTAPNNDIPLPYHLDYQGKRLTTLGEAAAFILNLTEEQRAEHHWQLAHMAFSCALMEPRYLETATRTLKTALTLHEIVQPLFVDVE
jgi:hypothetical protein